MGLLDRVGGVGKAGICVAATGTVLVGAYWLYKRYSYSRDVVSQQVEDDGLDGADCVAVVSARSPSCKQELLDAEKDCGHEVLVSEKPHSSPILSHLNNSEALSRTREQDDCQTLSMDDSQDVRLELDYEQEVLGQGASGMVAASRTEGYAVKVFWHADDRSRGEVAKMMSLGDLKDYVMVGLAAQYVTVDFNKVPGLSEDLSGPRASQGPQLSLAVVMELAATSMEEMIYVNQLYHLDGTLLLTYFCQDLLRLAVCLREVHRLLYIVTDLKPSNVVMCWQIGGHLKLADVGSFQKADNLGRVALCGNEDVFVTQGYLDPASEHTGYLTMASDIYALGAIIAEVVALTPDEDDPGFLSLVDIGRRCCASIPELRPTAQQLIDELEPLASW